MKTGTRVKSRHCDESGEAERRHKRDRAVRDPAEERVAGSQVPDNEAGEEGADTRAEADDDVAHGKPQHRAGEAPEKDGEAEDDEVGR